MQQNSERESIDSKFAPNYQRTKYRFITKRYGTSCFLREPTPAVCHPVAISKEASLFGVDGPGIEPSILRPTNTGYNPYAHQNDALPLSYHPGVEGLGPNKPFRVANTDHAYH